MFKKGLELGTVFWTWPTCWTYLKTIHELVTHLHLSLVGFLCVQPETLAWTRTPGTACSLLGWSFTNSSYEKWLDSNARVIHLCNNKERSMWIINAHHCTTAICQSEAILHLWLDYYMYDSSSWAREMSAEYITSFSISSRCQSPATGFIWGFQRQEKQMMGRD